MSKKSEAVTFKLVGGLGNQLFIWATSYAFERKTSKSVILDASECTMWGEHLKDFNIIVDVPGPLNPDGILPTRFATKSNHIIDFLRALRTQLRKFRIGSTFWENPHLGYDPDVFKVKSGKVVRGYFQSHKYFQEYIHEIRDLLMQSALLSKNYLEFKRRLPPEYTVIHVRLGKDYKNSSSYFKLIDDSYLDNALQIIDSKFPARCKVVVSDDLELARILIPNADCYVGKDELSNPVDLLVLMSNSNSFIGSNSSLSWWGAFLMQDSQAIRIFPKPWFVDPKLDSRFLLPKDWIRIPN
jgi:hypothetical protein